MEPSEPPAPRPAAVVGVNRPKARNQIDAHSHQEHTLLGYNSYLGEQCQLIRAENRKSCFIGSFVLLERGYHRQKRPTTYHPTHRAAMLGCDQGEKAFIVGWSAQAARVGHGVWTGLEATVMPRGEDGRGGWRLGDDAQRRGTLLHRCRCAGQALRCCPRPELPLAAQVCL